MYNPLITSSKVCITAIVTLVVGSLVDALLAKIGISITNEDKAKLVDFLVLSVAAGGWVGFKNILKNGLGVEVPKWL